MIEKKNNSQNLTRWAFWLLNNLGERGVKSCPPPPNSMNPQQVKSYLWNFTHVRYYIKSFKEYQNSNQGHKTFLMTIFQDGHWS